jgi:hypothetical protein
MFLYSFRWLAVVSWGLSTLSNNTALLITLLYWSFEFQGGEVTFLDFFHHAFQVNFSFYAPEHPLEGENERAGGGE